MDVLRAAGAPLSPGQVRERLTARQLEELSYSTVVTIVSRLRAEGLLERERTGRAFAYAGHNASLTASQTSQALQAGTDHGAVLSRLRPACPAGTPGCCASCSVRTEDQPGRTRWSHAPAGFRPGGGGRPAAGADLEPRL